MPKAKMNRRSHIIQKQRNSKKNLNKVISLAKEIESKEAQWEAYQALSTAYFNLNDFKNAYENHKLSTEVKDSLFNEESSRQIAEMQTKYETEKKEQQISLLSKDKELQGAQLNRHQIIIWSVAV